MGQQPTQHRRPQRLRGAAPDCSSEASGSLLSNATTSSNNLELYRKGIDTIVYRLLEGGVTEMLDGLYEGFSINSNKKYEVWFFGVRFDATYNETKQRRMITLGYLGDPVIDIARIFDLGISKETRYFITFYGAYFYIDDLVDVLPLFTKQYRKFLKVSRIDICIDVNLTVEELHSSYRTQFKRKDIKENSGHIETFYLGKNPKKRTDKFFIRVYDKKIDALAKGKIHLLLDYASLPVVTRIEAELHTIKINELRITPEVIINYWEAKRKDFAGTSDIFEQHFSTLCMNKSGTYFHCLEELNLQKGESKTAKFRGKGTIIHNNIPYIKTFLGYAKRIEKELKFDAVRLVSDFLNKDENQILDLKAYVKP